jgi:hypothetical protein
MRIETWFRMRFFSKPTLSKTSSALVAQTAEMSSSSSRQFLQITAKSSIPRIRAGTFTSRAKIDFHPMAPSFS